jgi:hypothetical protein
MRADIDRLLAERQGWLDEIERLRAALKELAERHAELVNSGDCGFWEVEAEPEMIAARQALRTGE